MSGKTVVLFTPEELAEHDKMIYDKAVAEERVIHMAYRLRIDLTPPAPVDKVFTPNEVAEIKRSYFQFGYEVGEDRVDMVEHDVAVADRAIAEFKAKSKSEVLTQIADDIRLLATALNVAHQNLNAGEKVFGLPQSAPVAEVKQNNITDELVEELASISHKSDVDYTDNQSTDPDDSQRYWHGIGYLSRENYRHGIRAVLARLEEKGLLK